MASTVEQQIARQEAKIARLREKKRKQEAGGKIVIGGVMLALARERDDVRKLVIRALRERVNRDADKTRVQGFLDELESLASPDPGQGQGPGQNPA